MIKFSATNALVHSVTPVIEIESRSGGQPFCKRELIIDDSWEKDGKLYTNFVSIEFTGDKMAQLDRIYPGMRVNVDGLLSGREYNNRIYNTVRGQSVSPYQAQQPSAPAPAPMPGSYPQQPQYQQAPGYQAAPMPSGYPQQPQYQQAPGYQAAPMPSGYPQQPAAPAYPQQPQQYAPSPAPATAPVTAPAQRPYSSPSSPGVNDLPFPH